MPVTSVSVSQLLAANFKGLSFSVELVTWTSCLIGCRVSTAGVFCAIVSHPADSVVSVLNKEKGSTAAQVLKRLGPKGACVLCRWLGL